MLPFSNLDESLLEAICEGIYLSSYSFKRYKTNDEEKAPLRLHDITILINSEPTKFQSIVDKANLLPDAIYFARDLGNLPPNECSSAARGLCDIAL